jgi:hypothetical protein
MYLQKVINSETFFLN